MAEQQIDLDWLLDADAATPRIVAETETTIVVLLRLDKTRLRDVMRRFGPFISALLDV